MKSPVWLICKEDGKKCKGISGLKAHAKQHVELRPRLLAERCHNCGELLRRQGTATYCQRCRDATF